MKNASKNTYISQNKMQKYVQAMEEERKQSILAPIKEESELKGESLMELDDIRDLPKEMAHMDRLSDGSNDSDEEIDDQDLLEDMYAMPPPPPMPLMMQ